MLNSRGIKFANISENKILEDNSELTVLVILDGITGKPFSGKGYNCQSVLNVYNTFETCQGM